MTRTAMPRFALAGTLLASALALWLSSGQSGQAATADQAQGTTVAVQGKEISWAPNGACQTDPSNGLPTVDFGISPPGGGDIDSPNLPGAESPLEGCVLSNATWNVDAVSTDLTGSENPNSVIAAANVALTAQGVGEGLGVVPVSQACDGSDFANGIYCPLGNSQTIVSGASPSPGGAGFSYGYRLTVPASTPADTYTGSVTFTASN